MPPSFGELFRSGAHLVPDSSTKWLESLQVAMFNWLSLGRPMSVPLFLRLGILLSARQWSVVKILLCLVVDGTTLKFVEAAGTERFSVIQEGYEVYLYVLSWVVETAHVFVRSFAGLRQEVQVHCRDRLLRQCDQRSGEVVERSDLILNGTGAERPLFPMSGPFDPKSYSVMGCCGLYELPLDRVSLLDEVAASSSVSLLAESAKGMFVSSNVTGGNRGMRVIGSQSDPFVCCVPGHGLLSDEEEVAALKCKFHSFWEVMARTFTFRPCWRSEIRFLQHRLGSLMKLFVLEEMRVANCLPISKCLASANRQLNLGPDWQSRALLHFLKAMMQPSFLHCFGWDAGSWSLYVVMAASGADAPIYESFPPVAFMETLHWCGGLGQGSFHSCGGWMLYVGPPSAEFQRFPADLWGSHHINLLQAMTEESVCWRAAMPGEISATGTEPDRSSAPSPNRQAHSTAENRRNGGLNGRTNLSAEVDELLRALPWQQFFFGEGGICNSARNLHSGPLRQRPLHADGIWCFKMFGASLTRLSASRCPLRAFPLSQTSRCWKAEGLDVAGCSMTGSLRVGEALHPGPRTRRTPVRLGALSDVQLLTPQTLALEARQLDAFKRWCLNFMPGVDIEALFATVPQFLPWALRSFSEAMFKNGGALSNYRHLVLAAQRWVPSSRVYMMPAWEMVEKWEMLTPVNHRTPIPETLVTAMCALAWHLKWYGWVGATVLAFYGAGRLGEILRCSREDLVLPSDVLEPIGAPVFLRLRSFKSQTRQPAKVQHMKVVDATASRILTVIFRKLPLEAPLFGASPYQYRKRWDLLLEKLGIGKDFQLTPGGLRGGAAVYHYKNGKAIADLLWLLRLRSQSTLESYLQEVAALNLLAKLSPKVRSCIQTFAATFAFLTAGDCPLAG